MIRVPIFFANPLPARQMVERQGSQNQPSGERRQEIHPESARHANCGCRLKCCGGSKPANAALILKNNPRANKTNPADDLRRDASDIRGRMDRDQAECTGPYGDRHIGANARVARVALSFPTDQAADQRSENHARGIKQFSLDIHFC